MGKDLDEFISELDRGKYWDEQAKLTNAYLETCKDITDPVALHAAAMEYARRVSILTVSQYHDWITAER